MDVLALDGVVAVAPKHQLVRVPRDKLPRVRLVAHQRLHIACPRIVVPDEGAAQAVIIGDKLARSGETFDVINPADARTIATVPSCSREDAQSAIGAAREAFDSWSRTKPEERANLLEVAGKALLARREEGLGHGSGRRERLRQRLLAEGALALELGRGHVERDVFFQPIPGNNHGCLSGGCGMQIQVGVNH